MQHSGIKDVVKPNVHTVFPTMDKYLYTKQRAVFYAAKGLNATAISKALLKEGLSYTPKSVSLLLRKLREGKNIARQPSAGRASKVTQRLKDIVDEQMQKDNETTAAELDCILHKKGIKLSRSTILPCRLLSNNQRSKQAKEIIMVHGEPE